MFTKDDLKTGMFVKLRDTRIGMVIKDNIIINKGGFLRLTAYNKSLCCVFPSKNSTFDIIEVRDRGEYGYDFNMFDFMDLKYKEKRFTKSDIKDGDVVIIEFKNDIEENAIKKIYYVVNGRMLPCDRTYAALTLDDSCGNLKVSGGEIIRVYRPRDRFQYDYLPASEVVYERAEEFIEI